MVVPKGPPVNGESKPVGNIMDFAPFANIMPFGPCTAPLNPAVIAAKAAGSPSAPCVPATVAPWIPGSPTVLVNNFPAINANCKLMCTWGGMISAANPGTIKTQG